MCILANFMDKDENMCCGDGVWSTFLAVMQCLLFFFCGVVMLRAFHMHVSLFVIFENSFKLL